MNVLGAGDGAFARGVALRLLDAFRTRRRTDRLARARGARPAWNASCRAYVLNFNGRVTRPSVKNFQFGFAAARNDADVSGDDASHPRVFAQFGRVDDNLFTLDFAHPLGPLTAFAACLSAFESRLLGSDVPMQGVPIGCAPTAGRRGRAQRGRARARRRLRCRLPAARASDRRRSKARGTVCLHGVGLIHPELRRRRGYSGDDVLSLADALKLGDDDKEYVMAMHFKCTSTRRDITGICQDT